MPFTASHAAAAVPFFRTRLVPAALVIGCTAPDLEYFLRMEAAGGFGHTFWGIFAFDLPVSLAVLWLFCAYAKEPLYGWLPRSVRRRIALGPAQFPARTLSQFAMVCLSIVIGAVTHILWDSFTHRAFWPYHHWPILKRTVTLPIYGPLEYLRVLQHASTIFGALVLVFWFIGWYRRTSPLPLSQEDSENMPRRGVLLLIILFALVAAPLRAVLGEGVPNDYSSSKVFFIETVVTSITLFWAGVIVYGAVRARTRRQLINV